MGEEEEDCLPRWEKSSSLAMVMLAKMRAKAGIDDDADVIEIDDSSSDNVPVKKEKGKDTGFVEKDDRTKKLKESMQALKVLFNSHEREQSEVMGKLDKVLAGQAANRNNLPQQPFPQQRLPQAAMFQHSTPPRYGLGFQATAHPGILAQAQGGTAHLGALAPSHSQYGIGTFPVHNSNYRCGNLLPQNLRSADKNERNNRSDTRNGGNDRDGSIQFCLFCVVM